MFRLLLASTFVTLALGGTLKIHERIVGGEDALIVDHPYQVSLQFFGNHICGGSIVGAKKILTAAHCSAGVTPRSLTVRHSTSFKGEGGIVANVVDVALHPSFDLFTNDYDVSVLTLEKEINFNLLAKPVSLAASVTLESDRVAVSTGWGALASEGLSPRKLQAVEVAEVNWDECNTKYNGTITDRMICFASPGKDACQGDSGGPLVVGDVQIGIVTVRYTCADPTLPGLYSNVAELKSFIDSNLT